MIDPRANTVETTINLTSFDEDPRPPFRFVTGGVAPTHAAMIHKPLYHGCVDAHGAVPSPDGRYLATSGRGSSNVYLIDAAAKKVVGNTPNALAGPTTNAERISSGILVGREPHEPTFTRNGRELWVTLRGENRIAILDVERALRQAGGVESGAILGFVATVEGPAQVWFDANGQVAFVASQKVPMVDVFRVNPDGGGHSRPQRIATIDISAQDKPGFTPFLKTSPASTMAGREAWPPAGSPSSTGARRPALARSRERSSPGDASRTACGPIPPTTCCTSPTSRTSCPARRTPARPAAALSTSPIPSTRNSSRRSRWAP